MIENSSFDQEEGRYLHWRQLHKPNYINTRECIQKNQALGPNRQGARSHLRSWDRRVTELTPPTPTQDKVDSPKTPSPGHRHHPLPRVHPRHRPGRPQLQQNRPRRPSKREKNHRNRISPTPPQTIKTRRSKTPAYKSH